MRGRKRCFLHGGRNIHGAGFGNSSALKHGRTTAVALAAKREAAAKGKAVKQVVQEAVEAANAAVVTLAAAGNGGSLK